MKNHTLKDSNINFFKSFIPLILFYVIMFFSYFASFLLTVIFSKQSLTESSGTVDNGICGCLGYSLAILIFGYWVLIKKSHEKSGDFLNQAASNSHIRIYISENFLKIILCIIFLLVIAFSFEGFTDSIIAILSASFPNFFKSYSVMITSVTKSPSILRFISIVFLAPIAEELCFRKVTLEYAKLSIGTIPAIILESLLFAVYHGNIIQGVYAFIAGILLSGLMLHFKSVIPGIFLHIMINFSAYIFPSAVISTKNGAIITGTISLIVLILFTALLFSRKGVFQMPSQSDH